MGVLGGDNKQYLVVRNKILAPAIIREGSALGLLIYRSLTKEPAQVDLTAALILSTARKPCEITIAPSTKQISLVPKQAISRTVLAAI